MNKTKAYSAASATSGLAPTTIPRRYPTHGDVPIEILFCGVCHSDLHYARDEWRDVVLIRLPISQYPNIVPPEIQVRANYTGADAQTHKLN